MSVEEAGEDLGGLSQDGLKKGRSYERENKDRKTSVGWLDGKIEGETPQNPQWGGSEREVPGRDDQKLSRGGKT